MPENVQGMDEMDLRNEDGQKLSLVVKDRFLSCNYLVCSCCPSPLTPPLNNSTTSQHQIQAVN